MPQSPSQPSGGPAGRNGARGNLDRPIRVALLEADELMLDGLESLLAGTPDLACVAAWRSAEDALAAMPAVRPDVVLLDMRLPDGAAFAFLKALPHASPHTRVLAEVDCREDSCVVVHPRPAAHAHKRIRGVPQELALPDDCLQAALKLGVHGALRRQRPFREVAQAIRDVHAGQLRMETATASRLAQQHVLEYRSRAAEPGQGLPALTVREQQVLSLVAEGRSNKEIARELQLQYSTVKNYVSNILEKLGLGDRTQLALYATGPADGPAPEGS